jgi:hypothetical protein
MKKKNDSPEWRKTRAILKIASLIGAISFIIYVISEGFSLEIIKNGLLLGFFAVAFISYFGCGLFASDDQ